MSLSSSITRTRRLSRRSMSENHCIQWAKRPATGSEASAISHAPGRPGEHPSALRSEREPREMARRARSPFSTRTAAGSTRRLWGWSQAGPWLVPFSREARECAFPPCGEVAARRGRPDSPAPAYELHDLTQSFVAVRRAEHRARVLAPTEQDELLRRARRGEAAHHVRHQAQRIAVREHEQLSAGDLLRKLVGHRRDRRRNRDDTLDVAFEGRREHGASSHRRADQRDLLHAALA